MIKYVIQRGEQCDLVEVEQHRDVFEEIQRLHGSCRSSTSTWRWTSDGWERTWGAREGETIVPDDEVPPCVIAAWGDMS